MKIIYLASGNAHKLGELQSALDKAGLLIHVFGPNEIGGMPEVEETGNTFEANSLLSLKSEQVLDGNAEKDISSEIDDLLADVATQDSIAITSNPILDRIVGQGFQGGPVLAQFAARDSDLIMSYLDQPEIRKLLPSEYRYARFVWG